MPRKRNAIRPLTEAQRELAAANLGLVNWVYWNCFRGTRIDREELISEGCVGLVRAAQSYSAAGGEFNRFAGRAIKNAMIDFCQANSRRPKLSGQVHDGMCDPGSGPEVEADVSFVEAVVRRAVESLKPKLKRVIRIRFFDEQASMTETGRTLGVTKDVVKHRQRSAFGVLGPQLKSLCA